MNVFSGFREMADLLQQLTELTEEIEDILKLERWDLARLVLTFSGSRPPSDSTSTEPAKVSADQTQPKPVHPKRRASELERRVASHKQTPKAQPTCSFSSIPTTALRVKKEDSGQDLAHKQDMATIPPTSQEEYTPTGVVTIDGKTLFGERLPGRMLTCVVEGKS